MEAWKESLEDLVDQKELRTVVEALATICEEKADHLRHEWQDERSARSWDRAAKILLTASSKV